jgi:two-component system OmpR family response regulator
VPKHILAIDDEAIIRELITDFLTVLDYRVTGVSTGAEALNVVKQDPPDLIITDLQLEESDGLEFIGSFKEILPNVPVILLTGMLFDSKVVEQSIKTKVSAYVPKTNPLSELTKVVRELLGD